MTGLTVAEVLARIDLCVQQLEGGTGDARGRRDELRVLRAWIERGGDTAAQSKRQV